ncbi:related to CHIP protein (carboxyl terminus of Hsc70-interacting protein) [Rhynchosporium agropyri]|uniref:Related to CHIP protein (Carboxyl terminus of Hsc70-interacting protein) n=1 Tax=Rhynchosporium agropyri TaxID=914238 RepID=A0A1E1L708_9HELO|nr:related to CHIP protein (carboxyl terminus of Hsc70-interacting protein) [Rhynchosporium agropyri]
MVNAEVDHDPAKALEYKESGNKCFQAGDYTGAEALYSKAITHDPSNPLLYTNRSMALLKLQLYPRVILDTRQAISLLPQNMKAYFQLAQAQIALSDSTAALTSAKKAHELCVEECINGGKGASSIGPITDLVLRAKKEDWERREDERVRGMGGLLRDVVKGMEESRDRELEDIKGEGDEEEEEEKVSEVVWRWLKKIEEVRSVFETAEANAGTKDQSRRRKVPDWCVDDITFSVMLDPVVTKTGQSYDRSSIMEHLRRSPTDPLTREPLQVSDLRPNLALKAACEEFLDENGWAVDW